MFVPFKAFLGRRLAAFVRYVLHAEMDPTIRILSTQVGSLRADCDAIGTAVASTDRRVTEGANRTTALEKRVHALDFDVKSGVQDKLRGVYENVDFLLRRRGGASSRKVVYTCIAGGGYDVLPPPEFVDFSWDYVCFTDSAELLRLERFGVWEIHPLRFDGLDNVRNARWHKTHPHILFPDHEESLWIDSSFTIRSEWIFNEIRKRDASLLIPLHFQRDCVFDEWEAVREAGLDSADALERLRGLLEGKSLPPHYGLNETCLVYRRHMDPGIVRMMEDWWSVIRDYSKRDQLSLSLVLFEHGVKPADIALPNLRTLYRDFQFTRHVPPFSPVVDVPPDYRWEEGSFPHDVNRQDVGLGRSVVDGWAFLPGRSCRTFLAAADAIFNSSLPIATMLDTGAKNTRAFRPRVFRADVVQRPDVRAAYDLPSENVGFHVEADTYLGSFRLCLVDDASKTIHYADCGGPLS